MTYFMKSIDTIYTGNIYLYTYTHTYTYAYKKVYRAKNEKLIVITTLK